MSLRDSSMPETLAKSERISGIASSNRFENSAIVGELFGV